MYTAGYIYGLLTGLAAGLTITILLIYFKWIAKGKGIHYVVNYVIWDTNDATREDGQAFVHHAKTKDEAKEIVENQLRSKLFPYQILDMEDVEIMTDNVFYFNGGS